MAASGRFDISTNNSAISGYVYWKELNPSEATNCSDILMVAYLHRTNNYSGTATSTSGRTYTRTFSCSGKSDIVVGGTPSITIPNNKNYVKIGRATFESIPHNSDGSLSVTLGFQTSHQTGNNSFTVPKQTGNATLTTIARASEPSCGNVTLGNSVIIYTNRKSSSFTHTISVILNGTTIETFTGIGDSKTWTPSLSTYAPLIIGYPASATVTIAVTTYNGSTNIGTKYCYSTISVPSSAKPTASVSISEADPIMKSLNWGVYVQGKSKLSVSIVGTPVYGSTIKNYNSTIEDKSYFGNSFTSNLLYWTGNGLVKATVTDNRNNISNEATASYNCVAYSKPSITVANAVRCDVTGVESEEGTYLKCTFAGNISSVNGKNSATFKIGYKKVGESSFTYTTYVNNNKTTLSIDKTGNNYVIIGNGNIEVTSSYIVEFLAKDAFEPITIDKEIGTGFDLMNFHKSGKAMAIGKTSEAGDNEKLLEIGLPMKYLGKNIEDYFEPPYCSMRAYGYAEVTSDMKVTSWFDQQGSGNFSSDTSTGRLVIPKGTEIIEITGLLAGCGATWANILVYDEDGNYPDGFIWTNCGILHQPSGNEYFMTPFPTRIVKLNKEKSHYVEMYINGYDNKVFELNAGFSGFPTFMQAKKIK